MEDTSVSSGSEASSTSVDTASSSAAPQSTSDIAAGVIADMEDGNASDSPANDGLRDYAPAVVADKTAPDPDDFDAVPAEVERFGKKQVNRIPHPEVKRMVERGQKKVITQVAKALGITKAEAELKLDDILGHVTETSTKYKDYDARFETVTNVEKIMAEDGDRFVRMLAEANPDAYGKFLKVFDAAQETPAKAATPDYGADPEPEPDYPLRDAAGQVVGYTHSVESQKKHNEWKDRQYDKKFQAALAEKFGPIEAARKKEEEAARQKARGIELRKQAEAKIEKQWARAEEKWPGFADHAKDIQDYIAKEGVTLHDAYIEVVLPKLHADANKVREEVIAETNAKPRRTSAATSTAAAKTAAPAEKSTADFAREAMKEIGG